MLSFLETLNSMRQVHGGERGRERINMAVFIILLAIWSSSLSAKGHEGRALGKIDIIPPPDPNMSVITKQMESTLNLTCTVVPLHSKAPLPKFQMSWFVPSNPSNSQQRVILNFGHNLLNLVINKLKQSDSGNYECEAKRDDEILKRSVQVNVKAKRVKDKCADSMFLCSPGRCIPKRYVCDGFNDCIGNADEEIDECGHEPCEGKVMCDDGRCIPKHLCCNPYQDPNCTVKVQLDCCLSLNKISNPLNDLEQTSHSQQQYSDMGFLQTTIYTVIGCAMAFMSIITILVIAICRVHMKKSVMSRCPRGRPTHHHQLPLYDIDVYVNRPVGESAADFPQGYSSYANPASSFLVTYNINNGVQFVGRPIDPPPYSEIVSLPPREGPPPPYTSQENISREAGTVENEDGPTDALLGSSRETDRVVHSDNTSVPENVPLNTQR